MTVKDVFGLIVRTIGSLLIAYGLVDTVALVMRLADLSTGHPDVTTVAVAGAVVGYITIGLVIILLAGPITRLAYGRDG